MKSVWKSARRSEPGEDGVEGGERSAGAAFGIGLRERLGNGADHALHGGGGETGDGDGRLSPDDGAGLGLDLDGAGDAGVHGHGRQDAGEGDVDGRDGGGDGAVDAGLGGAVGLGEIEGGAVALDGEGEGDALGLAGVDILVDVVFGVVLAVGEVGEGGAAERLGVILDVGHRLQDGAEAALGDEGQKAGFAGVERRGLGVEVAEALPGLAHVVEEDVDDVVVEGAAVVEADGGDADALFEVGAGAGVKRAGGDAADVGPVRGGGDEGDELAAVEDGLDLMDVVAVGGGDVGVVDEVAVTGAHVVEAYGADDLGDGEHGEAHEAGGVVLALGDELAVAVVEGAGEVAAFVDGGGVGGFGDDQGHLVADGDEGVAEDLEADGVLRDHARPGRLWSGARTVGGVWRHGPMVAGCEDASNDVGG